MRAGRTLVVLVALSISGFAAAEIYQYVDSQGNITVTTSPRGGQRPDRVYGADDERSRSEPRAVSGNVSGVVRGGRVIPDPPDRPNPNPDRESDAFDSYIRSAARAYDLPFAFIKAVIRAESAFDPHAISPVGAMGLMQLMPRTAESLNCNDAFDPEQNIMAGTQYLRILSNRYNGDLNLMLAAYNAGSGAVARADGIPYEDTRRYIERIYGYYVEYDD